MSVLDAITSLSDGLSLGWRAWVCVLIALIISTLVYLNLANGNDSLTPIGLLLGIAIVAGLIWELKPTQRRKSERQRSNT